VDKKLILIFFIGLLTGPLYQAYCVFLSGKTIDAFTLKETRARWQLDDGSIFRITQGVSYQPQLIALTPQQSPVTINITCSERSCPRSQNLHAIFSDGEIALANSRIQLDGQIIGLRRSTVGPINIPYPGHFQFVLETKSPSSLSSWDVTIKKNVTAPNQLVLWVGYILLCASPVLQLKRARYRKLGS